MENLREVVLRVNDIELQLNVLKALQEKKMTSSELQNFVDGQGGDWVLLLPILKRTNLLKIQKIESSRQYWYSVANHNGHDKEEKPLKVVLPDKSITVNKAEIKQKTRKRTDT